MKLVKVNQGIVVEISGVIGAPLEQKELKQIRYEQLLYLSIIYIYKSHTYIFHSCGYICTVLWR